jgi:hypothetical protein
MPYQARLTFSCAACGTVMRLEIIEPRTVRGSPVHCCLCGSTRTGVWIDTALDVDEHLAELYKMPLELFREVYDLWAHTPGSPRHLSDFVKELEEEGVTP